MSDGLDALIGWRWAFYVLALSATLAWIAVALVVPAKPPAQAPSQATGGADRPRLFDFRPVFRNRSAMAYSIGYCVHTWEMMALKGWAVAFLTFIALRSDESDLFLPPTAIATIVILFGVVTSFSGNEMSIRFGRQRLVRIAMGATILLAATMGFYATSSYLVASLFILAYTGVRVVGQLLADGGKRGERRSEPPGRDLGDPFDAGIWRRLRWTLGLWRRARLDRRHVPRGLGLCLRAYRRRGAGGQGSLRYSSATRRGGGSGDHVDLKRVNEVQGTTWSSCSTSAWSRLIQRCCIEPGFRSRPLG